MRHATIFFVQGTILATLAVSLEHAGFCSGLSGDARRACLECVEKVDVSAMSGEAKRLWGWPACARPGKSRPGVVEEMLQNAAGTSGSSTQSRAVSPRSSSSMVGRPLLRATASAVTSKLSKHEAGPAGIGDAQTRPGSLVSGSPEAVSTVRTATARSARPTRGGARSELVPDGHHHVLSPSKDESGSMQRPKSEAVLRAPRPGPAGRESVPEARNEAQSATRARPWPALLLQRTSWSSAAARAVHHAGGALSPMDVEDSETLMVMLIIGGICLVLICLPCAFGLANISMGKAGGGTRPGQQPGSDGQLGGIKSDVPVPQTSARNSPLPPHQSAPASAQSLAGAVMSQESLPSSAQVLPNQPNSTGGVPLCDSLVVPKDVECAVVVPASAASPASRGQVHNLHVMDPKGEPIVGFSVVAPPGDSPSGSAVPRVVMNCLATGSMLASCSSQPGSEAGPFFICRPAGEFFAVLERDEPSRDMHRFVLTEVSGKRHLFEVPKAKGRLGVSDEQGGLRAEVLPWRSAGHEESLVVRVGPRGDVGALLCGLICSFQILQIDFPFAAHELVRRINAPSFTQLEPC